MRRSLFVSIGLIAAVGVMVWLSLGPAPSSEAFNAQIESGRAAKDKWMRTDEKSPLFAKRDSFGGLNYFSPNTEFNVLAKLEPIEVKQVRVLQTSSGTESRYLDYAWAVFTLDGKECRLLILEIMDMGPTRGTLFLAFADETSGMETYGAGRYLDLKKVPGSTSIELDFNKAYNPYCAYNGSFTCPFPPLENNLPVAVRAGEKAFN
jgi:uncharacterized protein (DUF1684 family)